MIDIKILSYKSPQRYAVRRTLLAACSELKKALPDLELSISEVTRLEDMLQFTQVVILPSLMVNGKLVCIGRFPKKDEVIIWLKEAIGEKVI